MTSIVQELVEVVQLEAFHQEMTAQQNLGVLPALEALRAFGARTLKRVFVCQEHFMDQHLIPNVRIGSGSSVVFQGSTPCMVALEQLV